MLDFLTSDAFISGAAHLMWLGLGFALLHHERWRRPAAYAVWEMRKANVEPAAERTNGGEIPT